VTCLSNPFTVTNGVRQGGDLNQYLFTVYLNELSAQLGTARAVCPVGNTVVNQQMFADDIWVFDPRISGLQRLLNIFCDYAAKHETVLIVTRYSMWFFPPTK